MSWVTSRNLAIAVCVAAATGGCSRYSLDDVPRPDPDLAAPAPEGSSLSGAELEANGVTSMTELLQGKLAGVNVRMGRRGQPSIQIRGRSSFLEDNEALIVVDGVQSTAMAMLAMNPQDVAKVEVLKDGSAAIYGLRGANGVLLITTKREWHRP